MNTINQKNRRTGWCLFAVVIGLFVYSFVVIHTRGSLPEPQGLTKWQKIRRGL